MKRCFAPLFLGLITIGVAGAAIPASPATAGEDASSAHAVLSDSEQQAMYQQALQALSEGRRTDASRTLRRLVDLMPRHAGAWLDLALTQCGLGNSEEAERLFATVETRFAPSREILELIAQMRDEGCQPWVPNSVLTVSVGRGADANVNQGASTSTLQLEGSTFDLLNEFFPKRDSYTTGSLDYLRDITPNGSTGFAQLQWRRNDRLHGYDTSAMFGGLESLYRIGEWGVRTTAVAGGLLLGGRLYQRQMQGQVRLAPPASLSSWLPNDTSFNLMAGLTRSNYRRLANFDATSAELRPELSYRSADRYASAGFGLISDHGNVLRPGGNRHGQMLNLLVRSELLKNTVGELGYSRQTWRSARAYAPELLIPQIRDQHTQVVRIVLTYRIDKQNSLQLEARAVRNQENISIFQYNNRQLQLSWQWQL